VEELPEELTLVEKVRRFSRHALDFVFRKVLLVNLYILLAVLVSFVFFRPFTPIAFSERVFWAGMLVMLAAGIVIIATGFTGRSFGVPVFIRRPEEARQFIDKAPQIQAEVEKRYNAGARLWFIGMGCIAFSALIERLFT
jgi:hypothetical protein